MLGEEAGLPLRGAGAGKGKWRGCLEGRRVDHSARKGEAFRLTGRGRNTQEGRGDP